jgi:hypothetical protein
MKKVLLFIPALFIAGLIFLGCQGENNITNPSANRLYAINDVNPVGPFNVVLLSNDNNTWIWSIALTDPSLSALSHFNMEFGLCWDDIVDAFGSAAISYDLGLTWDPFTPSYAPDGSGCGTGDVLKFDEIDEQDPKTKPIYLKLVLTESFPIGQVTGYAKYGPYCSSGTIDGPDCGTNGPCYESETAWGGGTRFVPKGNWATWFPTIGSDVILYAGQTINAGKVKVENIGGDNFKVTYTASAPWMFTELHFAYGNYVITGSNPAPGQFPLKMSFEEPVSSHYFEFEYSYSGTPKFAAHAVVVKEVPCP